MEKMSPNTFKERLGENTSIAALAVIVEDEALLVYLRGESESPDKMP